MAETGEAAGSQDRKPHNTSQFMRIRTADAPVRDRFDYWRSQFPNVDMQPGRLIDAQPYDSENLSCVTDDGVVFASIRSDATDTRFLDGEENYVMFSFMTQGAVSIEHGRGRQDVVTPDSGLTIHDCNRPSLALSPFGHKSLHISVPRFRVLEVMGAAPVGHEGAFGFLPDSPVSALLQRHLAVLSRHGETLAPGAASRMTEAASCLALACLEQVAAQDPDNESSGRHLLVAARRYIESRVGDPGLSAMDVARALGCSRARLYRIFARHNLTVSAHIWELRLLRSRKLLRDRRLTISDVATACAYGDLPAFSKAFRRRFGVSPRDWRAEAVEDGCAAGLTEEAPF